MTQNHLLLLHTDYIFKDEFYPMYNFSRRENLLEKPFFTEPVVGFVFAGFDSCKPVALPTERYYHSYFSYEFF